jgi:hypothetical protein
MKGTREGPRRQTTSVVGTLIWVPWRGDKAGSSVRIIRALWHVTELRKARQLGRPVREEESVSTAIPIPEGRRTAAEAKHRETTRQD